MRRMDFRVNEAGMIQVNLFLERDESYWILYAEHFLQKFNPERLTFTLLISSVLPFCCKRFGRCSLLHVIHDIDTFIIEANVKKILHAWH
jgi:hypothetical protein